MRTPLQIGIVGFGGFGQYLFNAWNSDSSYTVSAIADLKISEKHIPDNIRKYDHWEKLVSDPDIDIVAIVVEPSLHKSIANAAMENGKHVLIEKPLATSVEDAEAIINKRDSTGMKASVDLIMRFNPLLREIRSWNEKGILGKLRRVSVENYAQDEQLHHEHWFWDEARSGGILVEHGVHFIDLVHYLNGGTPVRAESFHHERKAGQVDRELLDVLYEDGMMATHFHSFSRPGFFEHTQITLGFDIADIKLEGWIPLKGSISALVNKISRKSFLDSPFFHMEDIMKIEHVFDESRPGGWGKAEDHADGTHTLTSGGIQYDVSHHFKGELSIGKSKEQVYKLSVQDSLNDLVVSIIDPDHKVKAGLEEGLQCLKLAKGIIDNWQLSI